MRSECEFTTLRNELAHRRAGRFPRGTIEALTAKEKLIHELGLVSVLRQIHDDLDSAVSEAYGWPHDLTDKQILERLVELYAERAEEERRGLIRWLRPDLQAPVKGCPC